MSSGYDALWYPVCYACGYLFLLLFIAGPLRRFGAYTIPDFAEGRFDSPLFRYGVGSRQAIHIIVDRGRATLKGVVDNAGDSNLAYVRARTVPGLFSVTNELMVEGDVPR